MDWSLLIGVTALVISVATGVTVLQMSYGGPDLTFAFTRVEANDGMSVHLLAHVYNYPIRQPLLLRLRVRRAEAHFYVAVIVHDSQGNELKDRKSLCLCAAKRAWSRRVSGR